MCISGIYAFVKTSTTEVTTQLNTGGINIQLKEFSVANGQESEYTNAEKIVMPGEEVSLIPRITNLGDSCYVRAKFSYSNNGTNQNFTDGSLKGMDSNWVKINNYWYYKNPIETNAKLDIFNTVVVPKNLSNDSQGKELNLNIVAEAVQAVNFTPDFTSENPWGEIEIKANSDNSYRMARTQMANNVTVEYDNQANVQIDVPENFFGDLGTLMPGDELTHEIEIAPAIGNNEFLFTVRPEEGADEKVIDLLQKLELQITSNGETIFDGNMYQLDEQTLGNIPVNQLTKYTFKVKMPIELDNEYAMLSTSIIWKFIVVQEGKDKVPGRFNLRVVKVDEEDKSIIKSDDTKFTVNGEAVDMTNGVYFSPTVFVTSTNQLEVYTISETQAPEGYEKYSGTIKLNVGFKFDEEANTYYIDEDKTSVNSEGLSGKIYEISGNVITVYVPNSKIVIPPPPPVEPEGKYTVEVVKVKEDGETIITSDETVFTVNGTNYETQNGKYAIALDKDILKVDQIDTYTITENKEPEGYEKYTGKITLKVGFKLDEEANKYLIDTTKTSCEATGISGNICKVSTDGTKILVVVPNKEIPEVIEPEGTYTIELIKVDENGTQIKDEALFIVNNENMKAKDGKAAIVSGKEITSEDQVDTYVIKETKAPKGYDRYTGTINLKLAFKVDEEANKYLINKDKVKCEAAGLSGEIYKVSEDGTKITVYVTNKVHKEPEPVKPTPVSPQTGDVKIKISIIIFVIAAVCLIVVIVLEKKNKKEKNK